MSVTQGNGACPAILIGLNALQPEQVNLVTPSGLLQSTFDPSNMRGDSVINDFDAEGGHLKTVRVAYKQRATPDEIRDEKSCGDNGVEKDYFEENFTPTLYREHTIKVSEAKIRRLCDAHSAWVNLGGARSQDAKGIQQQTQVMSELAMEIYMDMDALRTSVNRDLAEVYALKHGLWKGGDNSKDFQVYRTTNITGLESGSVVPAGFNRMRQEIMRSTFRGRPIVFGDGNLFLASQALQYGCCNLGGVDISKMASNAGFNFYSDIDAPDILDDENTFGIYMPGTVQFASYNEYVGNFARPMGNIQRGTVPDLAVPGLRYDMRIKPNDCGEYYEVILGINFDLWVAPENQFKSTDALSGVNGAWIAQATAV